MVRWNRAVETLDLVWGRGALAAGIEALVFAFLDPMVRIGWYWLVVVSGWYGLEYCTGELFFW